jgi:hypothetical protein
VSAYYNEHDPYAAQWLRNLIAAGHIAPGDVDERDIRDVSAADLRGYTQCHFFAGIGGWSVALRLAGWPDERPVWTGSCPCQPFSAPPARARQAMTNATCGLRGHLSSASAALEQSLVSRLRQRLDGAGSTLFSLTWKRKATPAGRPYYQLAASARRTSETGFGLSPKAWTTPTAGNACGANKAREGGTSLNSDALLAAWPTPDAAGCNSGKPELVERRQAEQGSRTATIRLSAVANLAAWPTPMAGTTAAERRGGKQRQQPQDVALAVRGVADADARARMAQNVARTSRGTTTAAARRWRWLLVQRRMAPLLRRKSPAN